MTAADTAQQTDEPRSVLAPENAVAWVDGYDDQEGFWIDNVDDLAPWVAEKTTVRRVTSKQDSPMRGEPYVHAVTGYVPLADHMALVAEVDTLRERLSWIETRLRGAGAVLAGGA